MLVVPRLAVGGGTGRFGKHTRLQEKRASTSGYIPSVVYGLKGTETKEYVSDLERGLVETTNNKSSIGNRGIPVCSS